jgi:hypothetical protein
MTLHTIVMHLIKFDLLYLYSLILSVDFPNAGFKREAWG